MGVDLAPIGDNPRTLDLDTEDGQWRPARDTQIQLFPGSSPMQASIPEISGASFLLVATNFFPTLLTGFAVILLVHELQDGQKGHTHFFRHASVSSTYLC